MNYRFWFILLCLLAVPAWSQPLEQRLLRVESRVYGWYGVAEPKFDQTIGRRELFRIGSGERFLKGLDGRLVVLKGRFQEGVLEFPALSPPPISMPANSRRQVFLVDQGLVSEDGFRLLDSDSRLNLGEGRWRLDLVVTPTDQPNTLKVEHVLNQEQMVWMQPLTDKQLDSTVPFMELQLTQGLLDEVAGLGLEVADLKSSWQGLVMEPTHLRLILPTDPGGDWSLQGSLSVSYGEAGSLAETSFVCQARPLVEDNWLKLEPAWEKIALEGQLPLPFLLGTDGLGRFQSLLPDKVPVLDLGLVTEVFVGQELLSAQEKVEWFLAPAAPGTVRLGLGLGTPQLAPAPALQPGRFRLLMSDAMVDRLIRKQVRQMLNPENPFRPEPPIQVGTALFVPIVIDQIFVRALEPGYNHGAFRFTNLVVDVGWSAGPLDGVEPLVAATGLIIPGLTRDQNGSYFSWTIKIEDMKVRSNKLPGDKVSIARELVPNAQHQLGPKLAAKQRLSTRLALGPYLGMASSQAALEVLEVDPRDSALVLEGRLSR